MRTIQLDGGPHDLGWVWATMLFPDDQQMREHFFAVQLARESLVGAKSGGSIEISEDTLQRLIDAPSFEELKRVTAERTKRAIVAGNILIALYVMDWFSILEPSMNKAKFVAQEFAKRSTYGDGSQIPRSEPFIIEVWNEFKSVAHLWGALEINKPYPYAPPREVFSKEYFGKFLEVASGISRFGCSFIPFRARPKTSVLDSATLWSLPDWIVPASLPRTAKRPEILEKTIKKYRAASYS